MTLQPSADNHDRDRALLDERTRWQLRALRRDEPPARELWDGIAARLPPRALHHDAQQVPARRFRQRWTAPFAFAATLVMALGFSLWYSAPTGPTAPTPVQHEAASMALQYQAAIGEFDALTTSARMQPTFDELDRNAALILDALAQNPDSRLLLQHLRRTYSHRLALSQRLVQS